MSDKAISTKDDWQENIRNYLRTLEEEVSYVESICNVAKRYAPEYEEDKVCEAVLLKEQG